MRLGNDGLYEMTLICLFDWLGLDDCLLLKCDGKDLTYSARLLFIPGLTSNLDQLCSCKMTFLRCLIYISLLFTSDLSFQVIILPNIFSFILEVS